ncbi:alpha/beta fold hydrolase [Candidatus Poriferisocius sp.]|uniref:alpha/beta fold hydrolase n=1 Tax=Candidatus Poriferisocius sp. TaxID=3101276 RepID=UPI003B015E39
MSGYHESGLLPVSGYHESGLLPVSGYHEFSMLAENASEVGLAWEGPPPVARSRVDLPSGLRLSAIVWGQGSPRVVFIHGGAQNAHTWDTVVLALGEPAVAVDLPGHGHSDWRSEHDYWPPSMADDVAVAVGDLAPEAELVVGMSLGGLTAICLGAQHPELVRSLAVVDMTPGTDHAKAEPIVEFISGPQTFESFDDILARTVEFNPTRSESSLRRGIIHNAREQTDGSWTWRWDPVRDWKLTEPGGGPEFSSLWAAVDALTCPVVLYRGADSGVVGDEDVEEFLRRQPDAEVVVVAGAGHSIQGDQPLELARLLATRLG